MIDGISDREKANAELELSINYFAQECYEDCLSAATKAQAIFDKLGEECSAAHATSNIASAHFCLGHYLEAERQYGKARAAYADLGEWNRVALVEQWQGNVAYEQGDLHRARWLYQRARRAMGERVPRDLAGINVNLAPLLAELGQPQWALELLKDAEKLYAQEPDVELLRAEISQNRGSVYLDIEELEDARNCFQRARDVYLGLGKGGRATDMLHNLATVEARAGRRDVAVDLFVQAIGEYGKAGRLGDALDSHLGLGALLYRENKWEAAAHHIKIASDGYVATQQWLAYAQATYNLALLVANPDARMRALLPPWIAIQSIALGLPEAEARANLRDQLDHATEEILESALEAGDLDVFAEVIETLRAAPLNTSSVVPAGISAPGISIHDHPAALPALIDCGRGSFLISGVAEAERIRAVGGSLVRLRKEVTTLASIVINDGF